MPQRAQAVFLKTELQTGLTFAKVALESKDPNKILRNTLNARKAYDTLLHFLKEAELNNADQVKVQQLLRKLKSDLLELGQSF